MNSAESPSLDPIAAMLAEYGPSRLLATRQAAQCMARGTDSIREMIDCGALEAHLDNASGTTSRKSNRVTSRSVLLRLVRTARYETPSIASAICAIIETIGTPTALDRIIATASARKAQTK